jgi:NAD(P)-dependent dehydrogenase (short-subunit alcohol dehydrogenase family)
MAMDGCESERDPEGQDRLVTGASRGIGEAIAVRLAMEGAKVVVSARTAEEGDSKLPGTLHATVDRIRAAGGDATAIKADLSDEADRERLVSEAWPPTARSTSWSTMRPVTFFIPSKPSRRSAST